MKKLVGFAIIMFFASFSIATGEKVVIPACSIVQVQNKQTQNKNVDNSDIDYDLENYIIGVVAGEMSPDFPYEALKAQAVAARTYAIRAKMKNPNIDLKTIGQNYITVSKMKKRWGDDFDKWYGKIKEVVYSTANEVVEYDNEPILAAFYSTSCGKTEECENVWSEDLPYLKSVESQGDKYSPYYKDVVSVKKSRLVDLYGSSDIAILNKTKAGYVKNVSIDGKSISGDNIRATFSLRSTAFDIEDKGDSIEFVTYGYGHGVGMSQYGACYMANNGYNYRQILSHYYTNTIITKI